VWEHNPRPRKGWTMPFRLLTCLVIMVSAFAVTRGPITFNKDVQPILMKNCQGCHSAGHLGPMSLVTYEETHPWAAEIRAMVVNEKMPPRIAESHVGLLGDNGRLSPAEVEVMVRWVDDGALEGNARDAQQGRTKK
jgi:hypothetical protein